MMRELRPYTLLSRLGLKTKCGKEIVPERYTVPISLGRWNNIYSQ
jgi:hypothetical protein